MSLIKASRSDAEEVTDARTIVAPVTHSLHAAPSWPAGSGLVECFANHVQSEVSLTTGLVKSVLAEHGQRLALKQRSSPHADNS